MSAKCIHISFWVIAALYIFFFDDLPYPLSVGIKALPIFLLLILVQKTLTGPLRSGMSVALLASAGGDIFLAIEADLFVLGLASFLIAHLVYAVIFWRRRSRETFRKWLAAGAMPILIILGSVILPASGELMIPVAVYVFVISVMILSSALSDRPWQWLFIGASTFAISDTFIAVNKFVQPIPVENVLIMATYYLAQYLIVGGVIRGEQCNEVVKHNNNPMCDF